MFGYTDRPPAVVHARSCAWDQSGQIRYGAALKDVTAFWGAAWNE
ncbi:hypothetical protein [Catellatospora vulcania]|nr:hypothetical protein [Catellatospora vulcania]